MRRDVHYFGLDILRLVAASLVLIDHFGLYGRVAPTAYASAADLAFPSLSGLSEIGSIGVEIFFLVSGFVIAASAQGVGARQFLVNRAIRVFPALWICGLVAFAARSFAGESMHELLPQLLRSAVLSPAGPYIDGVVWTLIVEAMFYLLVFSVLFAGRFDRIEAVGKALGVVSALFVVTMAVVFAVSAYEPHLGRLAALLDRFPTKVFLLRHGVFFALGILLWSGFREGFNRRELVWMAVIAAACTLEIGIGRSFASALASMVLWWAGFAWIVVSIAGSEAIARRLRGWGGFWKDMGRLSYPLYLNHYTLAMVMVPALFSVGLQPVAVFGICVCGVVASSYLIMRYPERMLQRVLRARLAPRRDGGASAPLPAGLAATR